MKRLLLAVAAVALMFASPLAQGESPADETRFVLRDQFLRIINADRAANRLPPLLLDPQASAIADAYCADQIRNRTTGHFTTDGLAPYMRYSFGGGNDGVSENAAAWSGPLRFTDRDLLDMIRSTERAMLREAAPHDGHRRAILDPFATHVGIGLAWDGGEFRLTQEFIRRYVDWPHPLPRSAREGERIAASARPRDGWRVEAVSVHYEPLPRAIPASLASAMATYALPPNRRDYRPRLPSRREVRPDGAVYEIREEYEDGSRGDFAIARDGSATFDVPFTDGAGVYTVVVWVRRGSAPPIAASNVSLRVERAPATYGRAASR